MLEPYNINGIEVWTDQDWFGVWHAFDGNYDGAPDAGAQIVGEGKTEQEAIDDLLQKLKDAEPLNDHACIEHYC